MGIYVILVLFIILMYPFLKMFTKNYKKWYCILCSIVLIVLIGFRDISLGQSDTEKVYSVIFNYFSKVDMTETLRYIERQNIEKTFYIIMKFFTSTFKSFHIFLFFICIPYIASVSYLIYKHSKFPVLSYVIFLALNYFSLSFTLLRHVIAMAFIIIALIFLLKDKKIKFLVFVLLASLFHKTALIFLIAYFCDKFRVNMKQVILLIIVLTFIFFFGNDIMNIVFTLINSSHYMGYKTSSGDSIGFFIINVLLLIFSMKYLKNYISENSKEAQIIMNLQFLTVIMSSFIMFIGEAFRMSTYFGIFSIILVPNSLSFEKNKKLKTIIYISMISVFIGYFFGSTIVNTNIGPYSFFRK